MGFLGWFQVFDLWRLFTSTTFIHVLNDVLMFVSFISQSDCSCDFFWIKASSCSTCKTWRHKTTDVSLKSWFGDLALHGPLHANQSDYTFFPCCWKWRITVTDVDCKVENQSQQCQNHWIIEETFLSECSALIWIFKHIWAPLVNTSVSFLLSRKCVHLFVLSFPVVNKVLYRNKSFVWITAPFRP